MQRHAQHIDRLLQQILIHSSQQQLDRLVSRYQPPMAIDSDRREGLVAGQHQVDSGAGCGECRVLEGALAKDRRVARRYQQYVSLAQGHVELLGEMQQHIAARLCSPSLEKRQMPGRYVGLQSEIELTEAATQTPLPQVLADPVKLLCHARTIPHLGCTDQLPAR